MGIRNIIPVYRSRAERSIVLKHSLSLIPRRMFLTQTIEKIEHGDCALDKVVDGKTKEDGMAEREIIEELRTLRKELKQQVDRRGEQAGKIGALVHQELIKMNKVLEKIAAGLEKK